MAHGAYATASRGSRIIYYLPVSMARPCMIMSSSEYSNSSTGDAVPTAAPTHPLLHVDTTTAGAAATAAGPAAAHSDSSRAAAAPAAAGSPPAAVSPVANVKWADAHLGRGAALTANGVYSAAGVTTELVGWTIGDSRLHVRSGLRSLAPLHLRVSARVHHVAFYHPALDADVAAAPPSHSRGGSDVSSGTGSVGKVLGGVRNMVGLDGRSGTEWAAEDAAWLAAAVESESYRLSRDGIVEHHFERQAAGSRRSRSSRKGKTVTSPTAAPSASTSASVASADAGAGVGKGTEPAKSATVNTRRFVFASRIPQSAESTKRSAAEQPEAILRQVLKKEKDKSGQNEASSLASAMTASSIMAGTSKADQMPHASSVVYDEDGITGDGPMHAALIKATPVAKIGRYLPQVACRVPSSSVFFELRGEGRHARSTTQPFVVEAPHVIFGGGRDRLIQSVAADGNPLVDARKFEYLSNNELSMSERTESLLCAGATVWVDVAKVPKKNTKTAADVAKGLAKTVDKSGHAIAKSVEKAATKTAHAGNKGAKGMKKVFRMSPMRPKKNKGKKGEDESDHAMAQAAGVVASQVRDGNGNENVEEPRPTLERSPDGNLHLDLNASAAHASPNLQVEIPREDDDEAEEGSVSMADTEAISILPSAPLPYQLVLDDILDFRVCDFPSASTIATFPISISSILNNMEMEERLRNPRRPSELTITLVQEASVKDKRWGVEAKITFRVVEVQPDTPLAIEKPEQDDRGRWTKSSLEDKMKKMRVHLQNIGKPKDEIEKEIKAIEEKEMAQEEERESAIVAAGIGKGYEQGAPRMEINRRQMFYDPERELFTRRKHRSYASGDLNVDLLKQVALHSDPPRGGDISKANTLSKFPISDVKIPSEILNHDADQNITTSNDDEQPDERTTYDTGRPMSIQMMRETFVSARDLAATSFESDTDRNKNEEDGIDEIVVDDPASEGDTFVSTELKANVMAHGSSNELSIGEVDGEGRSIFESTQGHVAQKDANPVLGPKALERVRFAEDSISHLSSSGENPDGTKQYKAASTVEQYSHIDANDAINAEVPAPSPITATLLGTSVKNDSIVSSLKLQSSSSIIGSDNNILESEGQSRLSEQSSMNAVEPLAPTRYGRGTPSLNESEGQSSLGVSEAVQTSGEENTEGEEKEQLRIERRERTRRSIQSMALMHLSFGGANNLVEGDELDMLYQMTENDVDEDKENEPPKPSPSPSGDIGVAEGGGQPPKDGASYRDTGKQVLLEEYPGALILLCVVILIVFTKMSVSFLLLNGAPNV